MMKSNKDDNKSNTDNDKSNQMTLNQIKVMINQRQRGIIFSQLYYIFWFHNRLCFTWSDFRSFRSSGFDEWSSHVCSSQYLSAMFSSLFTIFSTFFSVHDIVKILLCPRFCQHSSLLAIFSTFSSASSVFTISLLTAQHSADSTFVLHIHFLM